MPKLKSIFDLFDTDRDVMSWIGVVLAIVFFFSGMGDMWVTIIFCTSLVVRGLLAEISIGPQGAEVSRHERLD